MARTKGCNIKSFKVAGMVDNKVLFAGKKLELEQLTDSEGTAHVFHYAKTAQKAVDKLNALYRMKHRGTKGALRNVFYLTA